MSVGLVNIAHNPCTYKLRSFDALKENAELFDLLFNE